MLRPKPKKLLPVKNPHATPHPTMPGRAVSGRMLPVAAPVKPVAVKQAQPKPKAAAPKPSMSNILPSIPMAPPMKPAKRKK